MRKRLFVITAVLALFLIVVSSVYAVIWGEPDGDDHPYVGLVVFDVDGEPSHRCSGTLLSETVFLTAGHCTFGTDVARVWFETEISDPFYPFSGGTSVSGTPHTHPDFDNFATFPNTSDVGVVILDTPVTTVGYGALPDLGAVDDAYRNNAPKPLMDIVGYGLQGIVPNPNVIQADLTRYQGNPQIVELTSALTKGGNIHLGSNPGQGQGKGGACFGDSGGPALLNGTNIVGGVGSFVLNLNCVGAGYYYRVDTDHAQDFISGFLP